MTVIQVSYGTPNTLEHKTYSQAGVAKKFLRGKVANTQDWARKYAHGVSKRCDSIREEIDGIDIVKLSEGEVRTWQVTDEVSKVSFVWKITLVSK